MIPIATTENKYREPQPHIIQRVRDLKCSALHGMSLLYHSLLSLGNPVVEDAERMEEPEEMEDTKMKSFCI